MRILATLSLFVFSILIINACGGSGGNGNNQNQGPSILNFTADVSVGDSPLEVRFSWGVQASSLALAQAGQFSCTLDAESDGTVDFSSDDCGGADTSYTHTYAQGGSYDITFTVTDDQNRSSTETAQLTVEDELIINSFTAEPDTIDAGGSSTLNFDVTPRTASLSIDQGVGDVTGQTSTMVSPAETTTYTLTTMQGTQEKQAQVTVTVGDELNILSFTADPGTIDAGGSSTLSFDVTPSTATLSIDQGVGDVTGQTTVTVNPTETTTYTLTATQGSQEKQAQVTVTMNESNPTLTISVEGSGSGMVSVTVDGATTDCDATCTLEVATGATIAATATAAEGSVFTGWTGLGTGVEPFTGAMPDADATLGAAFSLVEVTEYFLDFSGLEDGFLDPGETVSGDLVDVVTGERGTGAVTMLWVGPGVDSGENPQVISPENGVQADDVLLTGTTYLQSPSDSGQPSELYNFKGTFLLGSVDPNDVRVTLLFGGVDGEDVTRDGDNVLNVEVDGDRLTIDWQGRETSADTVCIQVKDSVIRTNAATGLVAELFNYFR